MLRTLAKVWGGVLGVVWILFIACGDIADFDRFLSLQRGEKCGVHPLSLLAEDVSISPLATCLSPPAASSPATTLFVSQFFGDDEGGRRVTIYDITAITDGENATNVLGQPDFTTNSSGPSQSQVVGPIYLQSSLVGQYFFVPDSSTNDGNTSNRIMIWDVASITNGENAVNVLGQANFTSSSAATTVSGLNTPYGLDWDSTNNRLFVADQANHRVIIFDVNTISDGENAVNVLGQVNFTTSTATTTQSGMSSPVDTAWDSQNNRLFVVDQGNNRILIFDVSAISDGENAANVLGQANFTSSGADTTQSRLSAPGGIAYASPYLFVADNGNNRIMIWDVASITNGENAVNVLGQANFTSSGTATTQSGMSSPQDVVVDAVAQKLFSVESANRRVLVFDISTIINGENAQNIIGQANFTSNAAEVTQAGLAFPIGIALK